MAKKLEGLRFRHPVNSPYRITSRFGYNPGRPDYHPATDYAPKQGNKTTLHAPNTGKVIREGWHPRSGWFIWFEVDFIDNRKWLMLLAHMAGRSRFRANQRVDIGDWLGIIGNTGYSTGTHVHIEIIDDLGVKRDPEIFLENVRLISVNRVLYNQIIDMGGEPK